MSTPEHFEHWVDAQIRQAKERGEFENLAGHGKPLADVDGNHDELWWIKRWLEREKVSFTHPALALRKAVEDMLESIGNVRTEAKVREAVAQLNDEIRAMNRNPPIDGPPTSLSPLDVDSVVARWRAQRPVVEPQPAVPSAPSAERRRWFRRRKRQ